MSYDGLTLSLVRDELKFLNLEDKQWNLGKTAERIWPFPLEGKRQRRKGQGLPPSLSFFPFHLLTCMGFFEVGVTVEAGFVEPQEES